jgi:xylitol oxidase
MDFTPSNGEELQTEYLVPRPNALAAIQAVDKLRDHIAPLLQISELRTIGADNLWMSPCCRQPCLAIHFTWVKDWATVQKLLPLIEDELAPFGARPHWGKLFTLPPARLQSLYPKLPDFLKLLERYDPHAKFRNAFMDTYIFGTHVPN